MAQEWRPNSDRPNFPDSGNPKQRMGSSTWSFHERYTNDPEFKRQIDEGRKRGQEERGLNQLKGSLEMVRGNGKKLY